MPKFDYKCPECEHEMLDYNKRISDPKPPCDKCGAKVETLFLTSATVGNTGFCPSKPTGVLTNKPKK